jgi:hypothetical protein
MALDAIACTGCGSTDVSEYKPGSYVCGHCDSVFKYLDPSRVTVQRDFCECGAPIAFQCRACRTGICSGHDVWIPYKRYSEAYDVEASHRRTSGPWIATAVPAYRVPTGPRQAWSSDNYVRSYVGTNIRRVEERFPGGEVHLCQTCYDDAMHNATAGYYDEIAQQKAAGALCANPQCAKQRAQACTCCGLSYCASCAERVKTRPDMLLDPYRRLSTSGQGPSLCGDCASEAFAFKREVEARTGWSHALLDELHTLKSKRLAGRSRRQELEDLMQTTEAAIAEFDRRPCERLAETGIELKPPNHDRVLATWISHTGGV